MPILPGDPIEMQEAYTSREGTGGQNTSYVLNYILLNKDRTYLDELAATAYVLENRPDTYNGWNYIGYQIKQIVLGVYQFGLTYGTDQFTTSIGHPVISFNVGGGTQHVTNSISYTGYRDTGLVPTAMDFKGAIGVELNDDGTKARVRGVDIYAPVMEYSYQNQFENSDITQSYIDNLFGLCGTINNNDFYGRPAGSVLFKGARGNKNGSDKWQLTFDFAYSPNVVNLTVGTFTVSVKNGWDYLDILYVPQARVNGLRIMVPGQAVVHQVYYPGDFSLMNMGTFSP